MSSSGGGGGGPPAPPALGGYLSSQKKGGKRKIPVLLNARLPVRQSSPVDAHAPAVPSPLTRSTVPTAAAPTPQPGADIQPTDAPSPSAAGPSTGKKGDGLDALVEDDEVLHWDKREDAIRARMDSVHTRMSQLIKTLPPDEVKRYETFRRSGLQKAVVRRWLHSQLGQTANDNMCIAVAGIAKVFVGELIETACEVRDAFGDTGALLPSHIKEAMRRLTGRVGSLRPRTMNFVPRKRYL